VDEEDDTGRFALDAAAKFEELRARVRRKEFKKRSLGKFSLFIGDDIEIAVRLYESTSRSLLQFFSLFEIHFLFFSL
jgi:hypothetical protein